MDYTEQVLGSKQVYGVDTYQLIDIINKVLAFDESISREDTPNLSEHKYDKDLINRYGYINRHNFGLPKSKCLMNVIHNSLGLDNVLECEWKPFDKNDYNESNMPSEGYLGTATIIGDKNNGIGFHAWEKNDSEFVHYQLL